MFMNLDALPAGSAMFTLYVTNDPKGTPRDEVLAEEIDQVTRDGSTWEQVKDAAADEIKSLMGPESRVVGIVNQSAGYVLYDAFAAGDA